MCAILKSLCKLNDTKNMIEWSNAPMSCLLCPPFPTAVSESRARAPESRRVGQDFSKTLEEFD
jgi:hypothetical protein